MYLITTSRKTTPIKTSYKLYGHTLTFMDEAKYLGITFTEDLRWNQHITNICNKANWTLGFLIRNLNISAKSVKENAYRSLVRPLVEYASLVWDPYNQNNIQMLEIVQRRDARYINNKHSSLISVDNMMEDLKWRSLEDRRRDTRLALMYKIENNLVAVQKEGHLIPPNRRTRHMHDKSYQIPATKQDYRKYYFFPRTIQEWNSLPPGIVSCKSVEAFKSTLATNN